MALLADSKRKQKLSVNPRGLEWSQDDSKFGQKMLEKFGWSQGKGLGASESGSVEHIKVKMKSDSRGVGFSKNDENKWIPLQDEFSELLASLNASHGNSDSKESSQVLSFEERSKTSKGRLHYHKFARGKDLSTRNSEDLDCIFGRTKSKSAPATPQELSNNPSVANSDNSDNEGSNRSKSQKNSEESEMGVKTISSSLSVQEYFQMKMEELKTRRASSSAPNLQSMAGDIGTSPEEGTGQRSSDEDAVDNHPSIGKSRKRKHEKDGEGNGVKRVMFSLGDEESNSGEDSQQKTSKRKKKKSKEKDSINEPNNTTSQDSVEDYNDEVVQKKKKKKKSKDKERGQESISNSPDIDTCSADINSVIEESSDTGAKKKKKKHKEGKRKNKDSEENVENNGEETELTDGDVLSNGTMAESGNDDNLDVNESKKKKKKKSKNRDNPVDDCN